MRTAWHPPTPIKLLYKQLKTGQKFAARAEEFIQLTQLVRWAYEIVEKNGLFERLCETWRNKPLAERTWAAFKLFFTQVENDRGKGTAKDIGYANAMSTVDFDIKINKQVHDEITWLMCADAFYRNQN